MQQKNEITLKVGTANFQKYIYKNIYNGEREGGAEENREQGK